MGVKEAEQGSERVLDFGREKSLLALALADGHELLHDVA